jgi:peptidoglycan/LPS O-acetylase OafA/YrhL
MKRVGAVLLTAVPVIVVVSLVVAVLLVDEEDFGRFVTRGVMFRILSLGAGGLLAFYVSKLRNASLPLIIGAAVMGLTGHIISVFLDTQPRAIIGLFSISLLAISVFCIAYVGHDRRLAYSRLLLEPRPIVYLGRISYGIYLYHFIILHALDARGSENPDGVPLATWLTFLALTIIVPALSFRYIESPLLEIKNRLNRPRNAARAGQD